jgi:hypothetical protein
MIHIIRNELTILKLNTKSFTLYCRKLLTGKGEDGGWRMEDRGWRMENRGQRSEVRGLLNADSLNLPIKKSACPLVTRQPIQIFTVID